MFALKLNSAFIYLVLVTITAITVVANDSKCAETTHVCPKREQLTMKQKNYFEKISKQCESVDSSPSSPERSHVLFWMPAVAKSVKSFLFEVVNELLKQNIYVTVVSTASSGNMSQFVNNGKTLNWIFLEGSEHMQSLYRQMVSFQLNDNTAGQMTPTDLLSEIRMGISSEAFGHSRVLELINKTNVAANPTTENDTKRIEKVRNKIDVVVLSPIMGNEGGYFIAEIHDAAVIQMSTYQCSLSWQDRVLGVEHPTSLLPFCLSTDPPSSRKIMHNPIQRFINLIRTLIAEFVVKKSKAIADMETLIKSKFPEVVNIITTSQLNSKLSLLDIEERRTFASFNMGSPFILDGMRNLPPNFVSLGMNCYKFTIDNLSGHTHEEQDLGDKNIQKFMEQTFDEIDGKTIKGIVYIGFGTIYCPSVMSDSKFEVLVAMMKELCGKDRLYVHDSINFKYRFLFKMNSSHPKAETLKSIMGENNVLIRDWFPQNKILSHSSVNLFMTHGGAGSFQEGLCQVPMISVPINSDQFSNGLEIEEMGYGISIPYYKLTEEALIHAACEILAVPHYLKSDDNSKDKTFVTYSYKVDASPYKKSISKMSILIKDYMKTNSIRPDKLAANWIKFAIRHSNSHDNNQSVGVSAMFKSTVIRNQQAVPIYVLYNLDLFGFGCMFLILVYKLVIFIFCQCYHLQYICM